MNAKFDRIVRMLEAYANRGATGEDIAEAYRTTYRALPDLAPSIAMWIENKAEAGTVWADAFNILAA